MDGDIAAWDAYWKNIQGGAKDKTKDAVQRKYFCALRKHIAKPINEIRTLELGCGRGTLSQLLAQNGAFTVLTDTSEAALAIATKNFKKAVGDKPTTYVQDARSIDGIGIQYDVVFSVGLLEHFQNPELVMQRGAVLATHLAWHLVVPKNRNNDAWWRNEWQMEDYARVEGWQTEPVTEGTFAVCLVVK